MPAEHRAQCIAKPAGHLSVAGGRRGVSSVRACDVQLWREIIAGQAAKILRGAKPVDIPVQQPTKFELEINLQTAKVLSHEIPAGLVLRDDKLIE
jgi:putative ABC transport system substrate-binding protein